MRILRFSILAKILGYYLKSPKSRFSPALKSDFLLEGWAEFLQGIFLVTKEALCKISAKSSNKKLENWHPKNHDFRTFFKNPSIWPISENFKKCPFFVAISIFYPRNRVYWPILPHLCRPGFWKTHFGGFRMPEPTNHIFWLASGIGSTVGGQISSS